MKQNKKLVLVEDFDLHALKQAYNEGRLYIQPRTETDQEVRQRGMCSIMEYVGRIDDCAYPEYSTHIRDVWNAIVHDPSLTELFFLTRYASSRGEVNWYRVNVVICLLLELGVYRKEFTGVDLHCLCERTTRKGKHYQGMYRYQLETRYRGIFRGILARYGTK